MRIAEHGQQCYAAGVTAQGRLYLFPAEQDYKVIKNAGHFELKSL